MEQFSFYMLYPLVVLLIVIVLLVLLLFGKQGIKMSFKGLGISVNIERNDSIREDK